MLVQGFTSALFGTLWLFESAVPDATGMVIIFDIIANGGLSLANVVVVENLGHGHNGGY